MTAWVQLVAVALAVAAAASEKSGGPASAMSRAETLTVTRTSDREVTMTRRFAAPRSDVFAALTTPALLRRWLRAGERELVFCEVDLRPGGTYRYEFEGPDGSNFGMYGSFREVVPGRRSVHTESYDGLDWEPLIVTTELTDDAKQTVMVTTVVYPSKEICDIDFTNLEGAAAIYERLDELLPSLQEE